MFLSVDVMFKMIDYSRHCRKTSGGLLADYLKLLIPFPVLLVTCQEKLNPTKAAWRWANIRGAIGGAIGFIAAVLLVLVANRFNLVQSCFPLDHAIKLVLFVVAVESMSTCFLGLERMAGYDIRPFIDSAWLSRTVGEFWQRYNTRVHTWLERNVFQPAGGFRQPALMIFLTFFVSAVFHEVGFGIATSRFDGYQFTFFMLQAPAAILSAKLARRACRWGPIGKSLLRLTTVGWFAISSVFFLHGVNRVFPFVYASQPWLP
jgi:hypothetical protein